MQAFNYGMRWNDAYQMLSPVDTTGMPEKVLRALTVKTNPSWVVLNYQPAEITEQKWGVSRQWYEGQPACANAEAWGCDEYPYMASVQGGPDASLKVVAPSDNTDEGSRYGSFVSACKLGVKYDLNQSSPRPFLVIPMPNGPPATWSCGDL